jgi:hypothetical protein
MGLSFHYSGSITKAELLPELIEEIQDIATIYNWKYFIFDRQFPNNVLDTNGYDQNIYGICFTPPECETISICFLSNGRMSDLVHLKIYGKTLEQQENEYLYMLSVKTQFAGVELHQFIIQLFRHLNKKYFANFKFTDEGQYWETNDIELLMENFNRNGDLIDAFKTTTQKVPIKPGETIETYLDRLIKDIFDRRKLKD